MARLMHSWLDNNGKIAKRYNWIADVQSTADAISVASAVLVPAQALSNARLEAVAVEQELTILPTTGDVDSDNRTATALFFIDEFGVYSSFRMPGGVRTALYDTTGPYAGIGFRRESVQVQPYIAALDTIGSVLYNEYGRPMGVFVLGAYSEIGEP